MDVYLLLKVAGLIVGVAGPLPYGFGECLDQAVSVVKDTDRAVSAECVFSVDRPGLDVID